MIHTRSFPIVDAFTAGKAAEGDGVPISENPFEPGTLDHTQWIVGYQWGSDAGEGPGRSGCAGARPDRAAVGSRSCFAWIARFRGR